jgi:hypothetical protein
MKKIFTLISFIVFFHNSSILSWTYVNRIDHEQSAPGQLIVYINSNTSPGEGVAAEVRWGGPSYTYRNTRDNGTREYGSFLSGTANWKVTFNSGVLPTSGTIEYQVMGIGTDNNFYAHSGFNWSIDGAVPVELSSFSAIAKGKEVKLNWQTAIEVNNYGFEIERASRQVGTSPVQGWLKLGFINGHGNSNSPKNYSYTDKDVLNGSYSYRLKQIDTDGKYEYSPTVEVTVDNLPTQFELSQNYPNPFNPSTVISYALPSKEFVQLKVFNVLGNEIATLVNEVQEAGSYKVEFNPASSIQHPATGVYFYRLEAGLFVESRKMTLVK